MQIEDFKRWHWVLISLVVGGLLAYMHTIVGPDEQGGGRGITAGDFVYNASRPKTGNGFEWVKNLTVYPPQNVVDPTNAKAKQVNYVSGLLLTMLPNGKGQYKPVHLIAEVPFKAGNGAVPKSDSYSVLDFLNETKERAPDLHFKFAWWAQPKAQYALWMSGALLLIGGVWPTLINLMIGAGFARPKTPKEDYDLDRFSSAPEKAAAAAKPGMSNADNERLRNMQGQLEADLAASGMQMTGAGSAGAAAGGSAAPVKQLSATASDPIVLTQAEQEAKEYGGDYYPVVKPHHHVDEPKKH